MNHIIAYKGLVKASLGLLQAEYAETFLPAANARVDISGTLQRAPYSVKDFESFLESLQKDKGRHEAFAILAHDGEGHRYVGHTGIHRIQWPDARGSTGSVIAVKGDQAKGIGTEAKLLLLYHCFWVLGLRNVTSTVKAWNAKSLGHLVKCGYRIVGRFENLIFHEGEFVDEIILQVKREDFEPIWAKYQHDKQLPSLTQEQRALVAKETNQT